MLKPSSEFVFDIEASGLLDETTIDYTASPFKLKDTYKIWCIVVLDAISGQVYGFHDGNKFEFDGREHSITFEGKEVFLLKDYETVDYIHYPLNSFKEKVVELLQQGGKPTIVGHNIINYDLLALKLAMGMEYDIEVDALDISKPVGDDYWCGYPVVFDDTLVRSKTYNPDRYGGHSLEKLAAGSQSEKFQFRKNVPQDLRFSFFDADMLYYNIMDVKANLAVKRKLDMEGAGWDWSSALKTEKSVADIITRQTHRGFQYDSNLALDNVRDLDIMMEDIKVRVEPLIPPKPATATFMKDFIPPKNQLKKNLELSANMIKFKEKLVDAGYSAELSDDGVFTFEGTKYQLPMEQFPLVTMQRSKITDTTHIKNWIVGLGWKPTEYKDRCLATDPKTKAKYDALTFQNNVARYVDQTFKKDEDGNYICQFFNDRLEHLGIHVDPEVPRENYRSMLVEKLHSKFEKSCKVLTNPTFTVGQEKEIDPALEDFLEANPELTEVKEIIQYMTYRHRRNSIMGGEFDPDEDDEPSKGFLSYVREDGRIATPADTCGAATSRMKHRVVANVPRASSLYGDKMRAMFGVDNTCFQIGYDFDSLEARIEAHECWDFENPNASGVREYCQSLLMDKPHDVHSSIAKKISKILGRKFERTPAKSIKYGATYGAQAPKIAKQLGVSLQIGQTVFNAFWEAARPLKDLKEYIRAEWEGFGKKYIVGIDGRKVPTRAEHAILNSKFQSGGVICAKRAMVVHDRLLKKDGLAIDFFKECRYTKSYCQQLIAYHDEAQLEVTKGSVTFKTFSTKEECEKFKQSELEAGKIWSDIKEAKQGGFFVAYSRAGELAAMAVTQAGRDYNLNVDLTAGYVLGRNWRDCH